MIDLFLYNVIIDIAFISVPVLWALKKKKSIINALGINKIKPKNIAVYFVASFIALIAATFVAGSLIEFLGFNDTELVVTALEQIITSSPFFLAYLFTVRVFAEEVFFRAFLVEKTGILVSTVLFTLVHIGYGSIGELIGVFILGFILAFIYSRTKNIIPLFLAHMLYNLVVLIESGVFM